MIRLREGKYGQVIIATRVDSSRRWIQLRFRACFLGVDTTGLFMLKKLDGRRTDGMARRQRICELLLEHGYVDVGELSKDLNADTATIRRDLQKLEMGGTARRVHGGAYPRGDARA